MINEVHGIIDNSQLVINKFIHFHEKKNNYTDISTSEEYAHQVRNKLINTIIR